MKYCTMNTPMEPPLYITAKNLRKRRICICLCVTAAVAISLSLLFLILGLTVFKAKDPIIAVDSISLSDLNFSIDLTKLRVYLNASIKTSVTAENPNRVGFESTNSTGYLTYRNNLVGEVAIPAGKISARETRAMNVTINLMADRLISNSDIYSDAMSGELSLQVRVRVPGKVRLLFEIHVVAYADCEVKIDLLRRSIAQQICQYKAKL